MNIYDLDNIKVPNELNKKIENIYKNYEKKSLRKRNTKIAIAASFALFMSGFLMPQSYMENMPIYSNVYEMLGFSNYQKYSDNMNLISENNGAKITLTNAIYTGDKISYSYILETDKLPENYDEKKNWIHIDFDEKYQGLFLSSKGGGSSIKKLEKNKYIGYVDYNINFLGDKRPDKLKTNIFAKNIQFGNYSGKNDKIAGNWGFKIELNKLENNIIVPKTIYEDENIITNIDRITMDKANTQFIIKNMNKLGLYSAIFGVEYDTISLENKDTNKKYKLTGGSSNSTQNETKEHYIIDEQLPKGKYVLTYNIIKKQDIGYAENGNLEKMPGSDTKEFKNAPEKIKVSIPFEIN